MPHLNVVDRAGSTKVIEGQFGRSVMEVLRDAGIHELAALCGGCCSCATCHVYVAPADIEKLPPIAKDEDEMLDGSSHRMATSRLSCQFRFEEPLDGMTVTIAPDE